MKLFNRIFTFAVMAIFGVITLASCTLTGGNDLVIDMETRVYVSQSYDLVAKDRDGELLSDVKWSILEGEDFAAIQDGKLVVLKAGVFTIEAVKEDTTVTKKFSAINPNYWDIEYNLNGGEKTEDLYPTYTEFDEGKELPTPVRHGYSFKGWYDNASFEGEPVLVVNGQSDGKNIELYAKWELDVYTLEFRLNGGKAHNLPKSYSVENPVDSLPEATKEHYVFLGWYTEEGEKVEELGKEVLGVTKLVAKFEAVEFNLAYDLAGGSVEGNPETYTVEDEVVLAAPTKLGYTFLGWELDGRLVSKIR